MSVVLKSRLPQIVTELRSRSSVAARIGADMIAAGAKDRVPVSTGRLRDAIHVEKTDLGYSVVAGDTEAFYGHLVEFGTTHSGAHPFLIPAAEAAENELEAAVEAALRSL